jgi:hypothetical protein
MPTVRVDWLLREARPSWAMCACRHLDGLCWKEDTGRSGLKEGRGWEKGGLVALEVPYGV